MRERSRCVRVSSLSDVSDVVLRRSVVDTSTGCWVWQGPLTGLRYASRSLEYLGNKYVRVCRLIIAVKLGRAPHRDEYSLHSCDNSMCVNPGHISPGTQSQNIKDAYTRGVAKRHRSRFAMLNSTDVSEVRRRLATESGASIARSMGVSKSFISKVKSRHPPYDKE